jgi:hypothetical protein
VNRLAVCSAVTWNTSKWKEVKGGSTFWFLAKLRSFDSCVCTVDGAVVLSDLNGSWCAQKFYAGPEMSYLSDVNSFLR